MDHAADALTALLPGAHLETIDELGGSKRSRVRRVLTGGRSLIVKEYLAAGEGWVRESAALSVLPAGVRAPRLVAAGAEPPIVVMSDEGSGGSVADALLGRDRATAADAVCAWATAIGALHRETRDSRPAFQAALLSRAGDLPVAESTLATELDDTARVIGERGPGLGAAIPDGALDALRGLATRLGGETHAALTPGDACPDNNVRTGDGLALIDFEDAQWRHIAWDVAYLIEPWPTCWCAWRIPDDLAARALDAYRAACDCSYVATDAFLRDVEAAATGWAFVTGVWFVARALAEDGPAAPPEKPSPARRAMLMHRLGRAAIWAPDPALGALAANLHETLAARWGNVTLPYAPAFR